MAVMSKNQYISVGFLIIGFLLGGGLVEAKKAELQFHSHPRPNPQRGPTKVFINIFVIDIRAVHDVRQTFSVDFGMVAQWKDPRLAKGAKKKILSYWQEDLEEIWNPMIQVQNQYELKKHFKDEVKVDSKGNVIYRQRYSGELSSKLDLKDFPFDEQILPIRLLSVDHGPKEVQFIFNEEKMGRSEDLTISNWEIGPGKVFVDFYEFKGQSQQISRFNYIFQAKRRAKFYNWRIIFPMILIVIMSWAVFWIDPKIPAPQFTVSSSAVLTLIIFQFSMTDLSPQIPYLTRMDRLGISALVLVFFSLVECVVTGSLAQFGKLRLARKVDFYSRIVFPILFVMALVASFLI